LLLQNITLFELSGLNLAENYKKQTKTFLLGDMQETIYLSFRYKNFIVLLEVVLTMP